MSRRKTLAYDSRFITCRAFGHDWDHEVGLQLPLPRAGDPVDRRCRRCGSIGRVVLNVYGGVVYRRYVYPEGYRMTRDEMPSRAEFRRLEMDRLRELAKSNRRQALKAQIAAWA